MTTIRASGQGLNVGLLFSGKSLTSVVETTQAQATLLAIEEINESGGINGVALNPVQPAIGPDPTDYAKAVSDLYSEFDVRLFFGTHMSNQRKAALPVIESRDALLFYPTLYEGFEYSPNCFYTGAAPNQNSLQIARYSASKFGPRVAFIGSHYIFAHESNRIMRDLFEQASGAVVEEIYLPLNAPQDQIDDALNRVSAAVPDIVYSTVVGSDTIKLYETFGKSPLRRMGVPILSLCTNEADLNLMSADAAEGHVCAAPYFQSVQSPANAAFLKKYRDRFGENAPLSAGAEAAYFQLHIFAGAARAVDVLDLPSLREALAVAAFEAPQGAVRIEPSTNHTYLWPRIARIDSKREFDIIQVEEAAVRPEPYMIQHRLVAHEG